MNYLFWDLEGHRITQYNKAPKIVCAQFGVSNDFRILNRRDAGEFIRNSLKVTDLHWVGCFTRFDWACVLSNWPDLATPIFELFEQGRVVDVGIYDKLLMLGAHGYVDTRETDSGKSERLQYNLGAIAKRRLGIELKGKDDEDSWRLNFEALDGWEVSEYPQEAREYALDDVRILSAILASQLDQAEREGIPLGCAPLTVAASFGLYLMTCTGVDIDPVERERVEQWIQNELTDERLEPLYASGILRRPQPSRPHANQARRAHDLIQHKYGPVAHSLSIDDPKDRAYLSENGIKFTEPKPASVDTKVLRQIIVETATTHGIEIQMTEGGKEGLNPQVSTSDEFLQDIEHHDLRLAAYAHRQRLAKIFGTELPRIRYARVHPNYDELKETGRTSSWDPNIQNVDPRVRGCYVPPPGWLFISVDYAAIELVTLAQKLLWLFGTSTLATLINKGIDPHGWLGARLSYELNREQHKTMCFGALEGSSWEENLYLKFVALKKGTEEQQAYYDHWRTLAKPTGLGYPGGLGPDTFITYAKGTYGVIVTREEAVRLREIWHATFPEMKDYFSWVNSECATGEQDYWYASPAGMLRNHCSYCACANGAALQTPAAEGGKLALFTTVRKCFDPSQKSLLYGCRPWGWIHDQMIVSAPDDGWNHERAGEIQNDMVSCMKKVIPDVAVRTEACLMRRWAKGAKPKFDQDGRLIVWEPKQKVA